MKTFTTEKTISSHKRQVYTGDKSTFTELIPPIFIADVFNNENFLPVFTGSGIWAIYDVDTDLYINGTPVVISLSNPSSIDPTGAGQTLTGLPIRLLISPTLGNLNLTIVEFEFDFGGYQATLTDARNDLNGGIYLGEKAFTFSPQFRPKTYTCYLRPLNEEQSASNGVQFGLGFSIIVEVDFDIREGDKVTIDTVEYTIRGVVNHDRGIRTQYKKCLALKAENQ